MSKDFTKEDLEGTEQAPVKSDPPSNPAAPAKMNQGGTAGGLVIVTADLTGSDELPDLNKAEEIPIDLSVEYWSPEAEGETKRLFFDRVEERMVPQRDDDDNPTGETIALPCAFFLEQRNGDIVSVCNGSKRLIAAVENNNLRRGTPLSITYLGEKKNKNNSFKSARWKVKPLRIDI